MGSQIASTIFGTLTGKASPTPVSEAVRERYASFFRTEAEGDEAYNSAMDYLKQLREKGDPTNVPDLPPEMLKDLYREAEIERKYSTFEKNLNGELNNQLKRLKSVALRSTKGLTTGLFTTFDQTGTTGDESLDARLRENLAIFEEERRKIRELAIEHFNLGNAGTATKAVSDVLSRRLEGEGSPTYLDQLINNFGRQTQPMKRSTGTATSSTTPRPKSTMSGNIFDTSGLPKVSISEVYSATETSSIPELKKIASTDTRRDASNNRYSIVTGKNNQVYAIGNVEGQVMAFRINR
jgi:hypothetical protein